jgi:hypothetical protein
MIVSNSGARCQIVTLLTPEEMPSQCYLLPFLTRNVPEIQFNVVYFVSYKRPYYKISSYKYSVYILYDFHLIYMLKLNLFAQKIPVLQKS